MRSRLTACLRVKAARTSSSPPPEKVVLSLRNSGFPKADAPPSRPHLPPAPPGPAHLVPTSAPTHCPLGQSPSADPELSIGTPPHHSATLRGWTPHSRFRAIKGLGPLPPSQQVKPRRLEGGREGPRARVGPTGQGEWRGGRGERTTHYPPLPCDRALPPPQGPCPASPHHNAGAVEPPSSSCPGTALGQLLPRSTEGGAGRAGPRGEVGGCERSRMLLNGSPFQRE